MMYFQLFIDALILFVLLLPDPLSPENHSAKMLGIFTSVALIFAVKQNFFISPFRLCISSMLTLAGTAILITMSTKRSNFFTAHNNRMMRYLMWPLISLCVAIHLWKTL